ncbi:MAG: hypothetical protein ACK53Y_03925, partial [bacterium]
LASAELPSSFWFYAVRSAAEICNYFPFLLEDNTYTTPFELVHHTKPDLRCLFKMFGLAAVRREREGDNVLPKFASQSIPMIAVCRCPQFDGLQFYNLVNGAVVTSIDYRFQPNTTSGTKFGYKYQPGVFIYRLDETTSILLLSLLWIPMFWYIPTLPLIKQKLLVFLPMIDLTFTLWYSRMDL